MNFKILSALSILIAINLVNGNNLRTSNGESSVEINREEFEYVLGK